MSLSLNFTRKRTAGRRNGPLVIRLCKVDYSPVPEVYLGSPEHFSGRSQVSFRIKVCHDYWAERIHKRHCMSPPSPEGFLCCLAALRSFPRLDLPLEPSPENHGVLSSYSYSWPQVFDDSRHFSPQSRAFSMTQYQAKRHVAWLVGQRHSATHFQPVGGFFTRQRKACPNCSILPAKSPP